METNSLWLPNQAYSYRAAQLLAKSRRAGNLRSKETHITTPNQDSYPSQTLGLLLYLCGSDMDLYALHGRTPHGLVTGNSPDISELTDYAWYEPVWYYHRRLNNWYFLGSLISPQAPAYVTKIVPIQCTYVSTYFFLYVGKYAWYIGVPPHT